MKSTNRQATRHFEHCAEFRFYEELNDFLPQAQRKQTLPYWFNGNPGIKDPIEVFGVPHTEVDLIVVNGESVGFEYQLQNADRVAVYPVFEGFDISPIVKLRDKPLRNPAFLVDINSAKLGKLLRLFGFDTVVADHTCDREIVELAVAQRRILLTRDRRLLYAKKITHGYWVRSVLPEEQLAEIVRRFHLANLLKLSNRCARCNGLIEPIAKKQVLHLLEPKTKLYYKNFYRCRGCEQIYWEGTHVDKIKDRFANYLHRTD